MTIISFLWRWGDWEFVIVWAGFLLKSYFYFNFLFYHIYQINIKLCLEYTFKRVLFISLDQLNSAKIKYNPLARVLPICTSNLLNIYSKQKRQMCHTCKFLIYLIPSYIYNVPLNTRYILQEYSQNIKLSVYCYKAATSW